MKTDGVVSVCRLANMLRRMVQAGCEGVLQLLNVTGLEITARLLKCEHMQQLCGNASVPLQKLPSKPQGRPMLLDKAFDTDSMLVRISSVVATL